MKNHPVPLGSSPWGYQGASLGCFELGLFLRKQSSLKGFDYIMLKMLLNI